jgi:hypothetical protein
MTAGSWRGSGVTGENGSCSTLFARVHHLHGSIAGGPRTLIRQAAESRAI